MLKGRVLGTMLFVPVSLLCCQCAIAASLSFHADAYQAGPGEGIRVQVRADFGSEVAAGFGVEVLNPNGLTLSDFALGTDWTLEITPSSLSGDSISFGGAVIGGDAGCSGDCELASFTVSSDAPGVYELRFDALNSAAGTAELSTIRFSELTSQTFDFQGACTLVSVTGGSGEIGASGGTTHPFNVDMAAESCAWTVTSSLGSVSVAGGTGDGTFTVVVPPNSTSESRTILVNVTGVDAGSGEIVQNIVQGGTAQSLLTAFNQADGDNDGRLSFEEAQGVVPTLTQGEFGDLDMNSDDFLTEEELAGEPQGVLVVSPQSQVLGSSGGIVQFTVSNPGSIPIDWSATVSSGDDFLEILAGAMGTDNGTIVVEVAQNSGTDRRQGFILVQDATESSSIGLNVIQEAPCTGCNCPNGGCVPGKEGVVPGIEKVLGDLFLIGLALVTLSGLRVKGNP